MNGWPLRTLLRAARGPFLVLSFLSVLLGYAVSVSSGLTPDRLDACWVLLGALSGHISVNTFNEYFDFRSGLDLHTQRTPFSGGSGALIEYPDAAAAVLFTAIAALGVTVSIGCYFLWLVGPRILLPGVAGIVIIITYTQWLNRHPILCLIAPGLGFGPLMVGGTYLALGGTWSSLCAVVSLVPFFLASNLLLLNQLPDIAADKRVGRRHFPIAYGIKHSLVLYVILTSLTAIVIVGGNSVGLLPARALIAVAPLLLAVPVYLSGVKYAMQPRQLVPYLGLNVAVSILSPCLLALALLSSTGFAAISK